VYIHQLFLCVSDFCPMRTVIFSFVQFHQVSTDSALDCYLWEPAPKEISSLNETR
jgi:hypothetical protein